MPPATAPSPALHSPLRFPLALAAAGILATGLALVVSALGIQWGAAPPAPDALELAWPYVNVAMIWVWLGLWPAMTLKAPPPLSPSRRALAWQLVTLLVVAIPAMGVSAFLHGAALHMLAAAAALQFSIALFSMAAMTHAGRLGSLAVTGTLASLALALPVAAYLWSEFFPAAWQGPIVWIPALAAAHAAVAPGGAWWIVTGYFAAALALLATAPRRR